MDDVLTAIHNNDAAVLKEALYALKQTFPIGTPAESVIGLPPPPAYSCEPPKPPPPPSPGHVSPIKKKKPRQTRADLLQSIRNRRPSSSSDDEYASGGGGGGAKSKDADAWETALSKSMTVAIQDGYSSCIEVLVGVFNADVDRSVLDEPPLVMAARFGRIEVIHTLLRLGASTTVHDSKSDTPLHVVLRKNHSDCVSALIGDPSLHNVVGDTPLTAALSESDAMDAIEALVAAAPLCLNYPTRGRVPPLVHACRYGRVEAVRFMLHHEYQKKVPGVSSDVHIANFVNQCEKKQSALRHACRFGNPAIVQMLLEYGAEVELGTVSIGKSENALYEAMAIGSVEIVGLLLRYGANPLPVAPSDKDWKKRVSISSPEHPQQYPQAVSKKKIIALVESTQSSGGQIAKAASKFDMGLITKLLGSEGAVVAAQRIEMRKMEQQALREAAKNVKNAKTMMDEIVCPVCAERVPAYRAVDHLDICAADSLGLGLGLPAESVAGPSTPARRLSIASASSDEADPGQATGIGDGLEKEDALEGEKGVQGPFAYRAQRSVRVAALNWPMEKSGNTPLRAAILKGNARDVVQLLASGASTIHMNREGDRPLVASAYMSKPALIHAHLDIDTKMLDLMDWTGQTALMMAVKQGQEAVVQLLCQNGACPTLGMYGDSVTALSIASSKLVSADIIDHLIGAPNFPDVNAICGPQNLRPIIAAVPRCPKSIDGFLSLLSRGANPNVCTTNGDSPLSKAAEAGRLDFADALFGAGALPDGPEGCIATPLGRMANKEMSSQGVNVMVLLLKKGADVNKLGDDGFPLLHRVVINNPADPVRTLLDHGVVDINSASKHGSTALMIAAEKGKVDAAEALIHAGADLNAVDSQGKTALMYAVTPLCNSHEIARRLVESGADLLVEDQQGFSALTHAAKGGHLTIVRVLREAGVGCDLDAPIGKKVAESTLTLRQLICKDVGSMGVKKRRTEQVLELLDEGQLEAEQQVIDDEDDADSSCPW